MSRPAGNHDDVVQQQYQPRAQAYASSAVHAAGPDLARASELVASLAAADAGWQVLDAGCGGGHLGFALAALPPIAQVCALDPTPAMLEVVQQGAIERGLAQRLHTLQGHAGALPFADAHFDLVASRYSAHHWRDLEAGLADLVRVLRPGGYLLMIDTLGHEDVLCHVHSQAMELLRDASHVCNRSIPEWRRLLQAAGVDILHEQAWPLRLEFASWIARMQTPPDRAQAVRAVLQQAPAEVRDALLAEADGSFTLQTGLWLARKQV